MLECNPHNSPPDLLAAVAAAGVATAARVLPLTSIRPLLAALEDEGEAADARSRNRAVYAVRNLLRLPAVAALAGQTEMRQLVDPLLGPSAIAVRAILFDKTPDANWKVPWHQDLSIAVKSRLDLAGFGPWSVKAGVVHVQPPRAILESMITLRLHLDDCFTENGPLLVLPGSHAHGLLSPQAVEQWRQRATPLACTCAAGDVLIMRPLILHASSTATSPSHRRVIHIEYAAGGLPGGLEWHESQSG